VGRFGHLGKARRLDDAAGRYIEFCKSTFASDLTLKGLKIVVDAAHGAAYQIAPKVFHELGAEVMAIGCAPDGLNINHEVGATHPEALVATVQGAPCRLRHGAGRRCRPPAMVDAQGRLFNGDELLYLMAADRLARDEDVPGVVVGTLMTNMAVEVALKAGASSSCAPRWVTATCWKNGARLDAGRRGLGPPAGAGQAHHRATAW
jgi:phosphoglucosamine mutase